MRLDPLMRNVLLALEMASTAKAATLERTHAGKPDTAAPPFSDAPHIRWRRTFEHCRNAEQRRQAIELALEELREIRYFSEASLDLGTVEGRAVVAQDTRPAGVVAHAYRCSRRTVYRYREELAERQKRHPQQRYPVTQRT